MLELLLAGLSTRSYGKAIGEMAETAGVSKSSVSRQAAEAAGERLKELAERRLGDRDYLIIYLDGIQFGGHHILAALGVDDEGSKRILGVREGASENAVVALGLLESLVERGPWTPGGRGCSSSTGPRRCARRLARSSGARASCSAAGTTRCAM